MLPWPATLDEPDFTAEKGGQLTADRQAQSGAAVLAAGPGIGLLERLEDEPLLFQGNANAGIRDGDRHRAGRKTKNRMLDRPSAGDLLHPHLHVALRRELERVGEQVLQNLLQPLGVARERAWQRVVDLDVKRQVLGFGEMVERSLHAVFDRLERDLLGFHGHRAGLDLQRSRMSLMSVSRSVPAE